MTGIERPTLHEVGGDVQCRLPLHDVDDREVGAIWWREGVQEAKLGAARVPSSFQVYVATGEEAPLVQLTVEIVKQVPRCTGVYVTADRAGKEVLMKHLKEIRLSDWIDVAIANVAREVIPMPTGGALRALGRTPKGQRSAKQAIKLARGRVKRTPEFLAGIAQVYRDNFHDNPVIAVQRHCGRISYRTAAKYVEMARAEGLLPPTRPGKKQI